MLADGRLIGILSARDAMDAYRYRSKAGILHVLREHAVTQPEAGAAFAGRRSLR